MAAQKYSSSLLPAKQGEALDISLPRAPALSRPSDGSFVAAVALSTVGAGLAAQSATEGGEESLRYNSGGAQEGRPAFSGEASVLPFLEFASLSEERLTGRDFSPSDLETSALSEVLEFSLKTTFDHVDAHETALEFAPLLGSSGTVGAGDVPVRIASNTTLPLSELTTLQVGRVPEFAGPMSPLLGGGQDTTKQLVSTNAILDPVLAEDALVGSILYPVLGKDGLVGSILDPVLGEGGLVGSILDPVLGEDGLVGSILDPVLGEDGLLEPVLKPLLGEDGVLETVLDPVIGEDGVLDTLLGDGGIVSGVVNPILSEDGPLGGVLSPIVSEGGILDTALTPLLKHLGPINGIVDTVLAGLFGGRNKEATETQVVPSKAVNASSLDESHGIIEVSAARDTFSRPDELSGIHSDDGFVERLLVESVGSHSEITELLGAPLDEVWRDLLSDDYHANSEFPNTAADADFLLDDILDVGLVGALAKDGVLALSSDNGLDAVDPELDALLSEILDSGERLIGGVSDPLTELLDISSKDDDALLGDPLRLDVNAAVEGALETLIGEGSNQTDVLSSLTSDGWVLDGLSVLDPDNDRV